MLDFYNTVRGANFYDHQVPRIAKALESIAGGIEEQNRLKERELKLKEDELTLREQALKQG